MADDTLFNYSMLKGTIDAILFQNKDNFYTVLKVETIETNEDLDDLATVVGFFPDIVEGDVYTFKDKSSLIRSMVSNSKQIPLRKSCHKRKRPS